MEDRTTRLDTLCSVSQPEPGGSFTFIRDDVVDPLFLLAPPRSFSSVICAMLGQHPQMHGLPETHLFGDETMALWWARAGRAEYPMADGLLRAVAQICFREQTAESIKLAVGWLRRRSGLTSGMILEELAREADPSILIEKSPSTVHTIGSMERVLRFFPQARFIHLVRHPKGYSESVLKYLDELAKLGPVPGWLTYLAAFPEPSTDWETESQHPDVDPQRGWYVLNMNIVTFLNSVSHTQWIRVRGEDLLANPDQDLPQIADWMGLRTDDEAIEEMKHPERSPYACFGPPGARIGNDILFLQNPVARLVRVESYSLEGPLEWRHDGKGFLPEVKELARDFGYC